MTESVRKSLPLQDGVNSLFCHELVIGGFIHKAVQFGRISQAQAKKPAVLLRIAVDERRLIFQRAVHFNDFAGTRRIDIRSGFQDRKSVVSGKSVSSGYISVVAVTFKKKQQDDQMNQSRENTRQ